MKAPAERSADKMAAANTEAAALHPKWDRKRGKPKNPEAERLVEKAHGQYSASQQGEDRKKPRP